MVVGRGARLDIVQMTDSGVNLSAIRGTKSFLGELAFCGENADSNKAFLQY
jgi:hypothetical protein